MHSILRPIAILLLAGGAACSRTDSAPATEKTPPPAPQQASPRQAPARSGRVEAAAALLVGMFPSAKGHRFICDSPLQAGPVPFMNCHVESDAGQLLDVGLGYGTDSPWFISLSGDLVNTNKVLALENADGLRYGPSAEAEVKKRMAELEPLIETYFGRDLGEPKLAMRRIPFQNTSAIVWTATYSGRTSGHIDIEPVGGSVIRAEF